MQVYGVLSKLVVCLICGLWYFLLDCVFLCRFKGLQFVNRLGDLSKLVGLESLQFEEFCGFFTKCFFFSLTVMQFV